MGLRPFHSSDFTCNNQPVAGMPDPARFKITEVRLVPPYAAVLVYYPGCTSRQGMKLLVLEGVKSLEELTSLKRLDPHFDLKQKPMVVARFEPTQRGKRCAEALIIELAASVSRSNADGL